MGHSERGRLQFRHQCDRMKVSRKPVKIETVPAGLVLPPPPPFVTASSSDAAMPAASSAKFTQLKGFVL
jgi:hypothetical protein